MIGTSGYNIFRGLNGILPGESGGMPQGGLTDLLGNPLFNFGMGMMAQDQYSTTPQTFGQAIQGGMGGLADAQQYRDSREDRDLDKEVLGMRRDEYESREEARRARMEADRAKAKADSRPNPVGWTPDGRPVYLDEEGNPYSPRALYRGQ